MSNNCEKTSRFSNELVEQWMHQNVIMDMERDIAYPPIRTLAPIFRSFPDMSRACRHFHDSVPLKDEYARLATEAVAARQYILAHVLVENGAGLSSETIDLLEASLVFKRDEFSLSCSCEDDFLRGPRTPECDYDHDSYALKQLAFGNWDKCAVFMGDRNRLGIFALLDHLGIVPDDCEYVLFLDSLRTSAVDILCNAVDANLVDIDYDFSDTFQAKLVWCDACEKQDRMRVDEYPAAKLTSHVFVTHAWTKVNDRPAMLRIYPYEEMPEAVGRMFEQYLFHRKFSSQPEMRDFLGATNLSWCHPWDVGEIAEIMKEASCGFMKEDDAEELDKVVGEDNVLSHVYIEALTPHHLDVINNWLNTHGKNNEIGKKTTMWVNRLKGLSLLWRDSSLDWRELRYLYQHERMEKFAVCKPAGAESYLECFWDGGVPLEDVFA